MRTDQITPVSQLALCRLTRPLSKINMVHFLCSAEQRATSVLLVRITSIVYMLQNMPNDTTKTSAGDRLSRYQFRNEEVGEKSSKTTEANKPAKPDAASASKDTEAAAKNMEEMLQAIVQSN